jgi:hypothetical protein
MFGFGGGYGRYMQEKALAAKLPQVEVTREEFIKLMVESGETQDKAEFQATICAGLGSSTRIGDKMVSIKDK